MTTAFSFEPPAHVSQRQRTSVTYAHRVAVIDGATRIVYAGLPNGRSDSPVRLRRPAS